MNLQDKGKTIGEMYAEDKGNEELKKLMKELREPMPAIVEISSFQYEGKVYWRLLDKSEDITIVNGNLRYVAMVGEGINAIFMKYGSEYYISGNFEVVSQATIEHMKRAMAAFKDLESESESFIKEKEHSGISGAELNRYLNATEGFSTYIFEHPIMDISELRASHIAGYLNWMKRLPFLHYSKYAMRNDTAVLKQFFQYLYDKGRIKDDKFKEVRA